MADELACERCRFWSAAGVEDGECRRYAPKPVTTHDYDSELGRSTVWPMTHCEEWCGEFEPKRGYA